MGLPGGQSAGTPRGRVVVVTGAMVVVVVGDWIAGGSVVVVVAGSGGSGCCTAGDRIVVGVGVLVVDLGTAFVVRRRCVFAG